MPYNPDRGLFSCLPQAQSKNKQEGLSTYSEEQQHFAQGRRPPKLLGTTSNEELIYQVVFCRAPAPVKQHQGYLYQAFSE